MEDQDLISWLEQDEARSRPYRAGRLRFLHQEYGPEGIRLFHGGPVSALAFEEARQAYLHGLFMACTIMSQVCVEHNKLPNAKRSEQMKKYWGKKLGRLKNSLEA